MKQQLRVLIAHNQYQQRGGEDAVVEAESALLRQCGCEVATLLRQNDDLESMSAYSAAFDTFWSRKAYNDAVRTIGDFFPDVIHVHNTFPLISPAIYWAATRAGVPVVQTLHNFRLLCPQAMLLRDGQVCEDCLGVLPWRGVIRNCYRGSQAQSTVLAGMLTLHRFLGTWQHKVTRYIALNEFCRDKFIQGGLPADRISIKPNFVDLPMPEESHRAGGLFVGRLSPEKGIATLLGALDRLPHIPVSFVGSGPEQERVAVHPSASFLGAKSQTEVIDMMRSASYLLLPSICYENFPRTIAEAFACGLPVIASRLGAMAELVSDGETGLLFEPGNAKDLAQKIVWAEANPDTLLEMGKRARREYEAKYTPATNYDQLMAIYAEAIATVKQGRSH